MNYLTVCKNAAKSASAIQKRHLSAFGFRTCHERLVLDVKQLGLA
jgi:hypothetical protein